MSTDEKIQDVIQKLRGGGEALRYSLHEWYKAEQIEDSEVQRIISTLKGYGLIHEVTLTEACYLTALGFEVADQEGGWVKYRDRCREKEELEIILKRSTVGINKLSRGLLILTGVLSAITLIVTILDYRSNQALIRIEQEILEFEKMKENQYHTNEMPRESIPQADSINSK